jgi:hypothetical protein
MQYLPPERDINVLSQKRTSILPSPRPAVAWPANTNELMAVSKSVVYHVNLPG